MPATKKKPKSLRADVIAKMLEVCDRETIQSAIMADFYEAEANAAEDREVAAKHRLKAGQVRQNVAFNERFRAFIVSAS
jgi:hypothetical protein